MKDVERVLRVVLQAANVIGAELGEVESVGLFTVDAAEVDREAVVDEDPDVIVTREVELSKTVGVALWLAGWQGSGLNEPGPARERGYLGSSHAFPSPSSVRPSRSDVLWLHELKSQASKVNDKKRNEPADRQSVAS